MATTEQFKKQVKDPYVIGIDLGTTNSVVSIMQNGIPTVLRNALGHLTTQSIVKIGKNDVVGEEARKYLNKDGKNTIFASKRLLGRKFNDPEIQEYIKTLPYRTVSACNGDVWIKTDFGKFSPAQIGAKILAKMKRIAEESTKKSIQRAVVTVPAYFNDSQRQATRDAGKIAGLEVIRMINEPTAAALAYGLDKKETGNIAVYDLGGGTFDISILELDNGIFHVKATNGDTFLGGEDFDGEFMKFIINNHEQQEGVYLDKKKIAFEKLKEAAEKARVELSSKLTVDIFVENIVPGQDLDIKVSREQLESVIKRVAQKTIEPCKMALRDAGLTEKDIKHVILVGGMTKMPYIRSLVKEIFGIEPNTEVDPDQAVAQGAAIQAGVLCGSVENVLLLDVTPLSLGIETLGGVFSKIIHRNTTIPFKQTETFSTSEDNQTEVDIKIYQGERIMVNDNMLLGSIKLKNITKAPRGVPKIDVTFEADSNGIIKVSAEDNVTKKKQEIEIIPSSGLSAEEVEKMIKTAEDHKESDLKLAEATVFKNDAKKYIDGILNESTHVPDDILKSIEDFSKTISSENFDIDTAKITLKKIQKRL
ncbi:hypothetical protein GINT2_000084 [Glugoides intestinalis]